MPLSGSLEGLKGDVYCPKYLKEYNYTIECKHYKEIKFNNLLTAKSHDIYSFWDQATREAEEMGEFFGCDKKPLVIFRWDRSQNYVIFNTSLELNKQITLNAFGIKIKIALLENWLEQNGSI